MARLGGICLLGICALALLPAPASASNAHSYRIAYLDHSTALFSSPGGREAGIASATTEFGSPATLTVEQERGRWLGVISTSFPNNRLAWVRADSVSTRSTQLWLFASLRRHELLVKRGAVTLRRFSVGVGASSTPTPTGVYAITDKLDGAAYSGAYGCCILALSGHQTHLAPGWKGGDRLAIHGTDAPWTIGRNASNGCLHLDAAALTYLMRLLPLGTRVVIRY